MLYRSSAAHVTVRAARPRKIVVKPLLLIPFLLAAGVCARAQGGGFERELAASGPVSLSVKNRLGRVTVTAVEGEAKKVLIRARSPLAGVSVGERDVKVGEAGGRLSVVVERESSPAATASPAGARGAGEAGRIDVVITVPARTRVEVETEVGSVDVVGPLAEARVRTGTGTIRADVPTDAVRYSLRWTLARPRLYSEVELGKVSEQRSGTFEISGRLGDRKAKQDARIELSLETARGVILFGVADEAAVPSDLRERELTEAARAVIRSGDADLTDAIRKLVPRLVGEYAETLPPTRFEPTFAARRNPFDVRTSVGAELARLNASVTDRNGRAVGGLSARDFTVVENGAERRVRAVEPSTAPFNLVLLLDVSGSVEERLDFIRKAALAFIDTVGPSDRVAITSFRDDVQVISDFTTDRAALARRIKDIQAGGATSLYDALAYTLVHTLKPLRGERTAVVILSDGDDNRSFIPFNEVLEAVVESGALVYPLYVPSGLIPSSGAAAPSSTIDPMRSRFLTLTSRAREEGRRLAELSGGVYYPITQLEQLQRAYDDVVAQLRTSYSITYESAAAAAAGAPRVRVRVAREGASVRLSPAVGVNNNNSPAAAP